jgi:hypothetical protein
MYLRLDPERNEPRQDAAIRIGCLRICLVLSSGLAYSTMQLCINAAASGDICNVHAGT